MLANMQSVGNKFMQLLPTCNRATYATGEGVKGKGLRYVERVILLHTHTHTMSHSHMHMRLRKCDLNVLVDKVRRFDKY